MFYSNIKYLEADLLIQRYGPVAKGDGIAETGLPLYCLLGEVHDDLGSFGIWMEEERADGERPTDAAAMNRQTPLGFMVASVGCGGERAAKGV